MRVPAVLSFEISGDLLCAVNLAKEVFFRNVVRVVDEVITADRYGVGLEPTFQNQAARQGVHVVHANHDCGKTLREAGYASFEFEHILNSLAGQRSFSEAQTSQVADGRRSRPYRGLEDIFNIRKRCAGGRFPSKQRDPALLGERLGIEPFSLKQPEDPLSRFIVTKDDAMVLSQKAGF